MTERPGAEEIKHLTVAQAVERYMNVGNVDAFFDTSNKPRLWGHDFLHTMLQSPPDTGAGEERVAIYQAVLLAHSLVTTRNLPWKDMGEEVTLDDVKRRVMPGIQKAHQRIMREHHLEQDPQLSDEEVVEHFRKAGI